MKPILPTPEVAEIYLENFKQFGSALMECGGEPFRILKNHDEFLRTLALNNISITAKYEGQEFKKEPTYYVDPKTLVTKIKKQEDCAKEDMEKERKEFIKEEALFQKYDKMSYEQHEAEEIEKECNRMTEEDWNYYYIDPKTLVTKRKKQEELQKLVKHDPMWQKPLSTSNPIPNTTSP